MGQYYLVANLDKEEFLYPNHFGGDRQLREIALSSPGITAGLAALLAAGNGKGSGDICSDSPLIGSWAGDRIAIIGDYSDSDEVLGVTYQTIMDSWADISREVIVAICQDEEFEQAFQQRGIATGS